MLVIPAIDLKEGRCVRLVEGDLSRVTVYGDDPVAMARRWEAEGAEWLHVVDLDGAVAGRPVHAQVVAAICSAVGIPVEVGGGLRGREAVREVLAAGAARAILGTVAVRDPELLAALAGEFPGKIAVGIDAREGEVRVEGWTAGGTATSPSALAARAAAAGAAAIVYTDIARDGTERGPDVEGTRAVATAAAGVPVIASGGVGSAADLRRLSVLGPAGVVGVIVGRALYSGAFSFAEALSAVGAKPRGEGGR